MRVIELENMGEYTKVLEKVIEGGVSRRPRGIPTKDLGPTTVVVLDPHNGMPLGLGRKLNPAIGAVEAAQLIAGRSAPELVLKIAPQFRSYLDDVSVPVFHGSYGDRISFQMKSIVEKFDEDPNTRQAVVTLWDPWLDNLKAKKDYPCTVSLQFAIIDGYLEMMTLMRSNDVWLGFPYDVFQFTQLQLTLASALGVEAGTYRHTALSFHLYELNHDAAIALIQYFSDNEDARLHAYHNTYQPSGIINGDRTFTEAQSRTHTILRGKLPMLPSIEEQWYFDLLHNGRIAHPSS